MSVNTGARLVRLQQPTVQFLRHRSTCSSAIGLRAAIDSRQAGNGSRSICLRQLYPLLRNADGIQPQFRRAFTSTSKRADSPSPYNNNNTPFQPDPDPLSDPLNPPASTRPPPLELPVREEGQAAPSYLFQVGKKYLSFYWAGIKAIFANRRLLASLPDIPRPSVPNAPSSPESALSEPALDKSANPSRAVLLLRARVRHDVSLLPLFGLMVLVCGELTPLIVLVFPHLTPYTCRIPTQVAKMQKAAKARRNASYRGLHQVVMKNAYAMARDGKSDSNNNNNNENSSNEMAIPRALKRVADGHICRVLDKGSSLWDMVGLDVPFASARAARAVFQIVGDDALLREGGGVGELVDDEVVLACDERGLDTLGADVDDLRDELDEWLDQTAPSQTEDVEAAIKESTHKVRMQLLGIEE